MDMTQIIIVAAAALALVGAGYLFGWLRTKGIDAGNIIGDVGTVVGMADSAMDALAPLLPGDAAGKVNWTIALAQRGVQAAEQMYKASQIQGSERKDAAQRFIQCALGAANIPVTPELQTVIDGAVESAVALLPPTNPRPI